MSLKDKKIEYRPIALITPNPKNPNKHSEEQIERLAHLIKFYGWRQPLIVSKQTGLLVVGHGRLLAAKKLGEKKVPVLELDFDTPEMEYGYLVADNAIAAWSDLDLSAINAELPELGPDFDIEMLGIKDFQLDVSDFDVPEDKAPKDKESKTFPCPNCGVEIEAP